MYIPEKRAHPKNYNKGQCSAPTYMPYIVYTIQSIDTSFPSDKIIEYKKK